MKPGRTPAAAVTNPDWDHPPVTLGRHLVLFLPGLACLLAARGAAPAGLAPLPLAWPAAPLLLDALLLAAAVAAGLHAAPRAGLNSRLLDRMNYGTEVAPGLRADALPTLATGVLAGLGLAAARDGTPAAVLPPARQGPGLLAGLEPVAVLAAVPAELVLRWGLLPLLALGLTLLVHRRPGEPSRSVAAAALLLAAGASALVHLAAGAGPGLAASPAAGWTLAAHGLAGLAFGLLAWRQSIEAAAAAHALALLVLGAAPPLL